jgi:hypothetical protein
MVDSEVTMVKNYATVMLAVGLVAPSHAAEYLTGVTSEVYQTTGSPKEIATRASTCISQHLAPGTTDSQLIISRDLEGGVIVARSVLEYGSLPRWKVRSNFTFEAREGRFRIEQTNLERFNDMAGGWGPIGKWAGSQWKKAEETIAASASVVARCVVDGPKRGDW